MEQTDNNMSGFKENSIYKNLWKLLVSPKVLTGVLHTQNKNACDWGWQGFLAHACHSFITIIDPRTVQVFQVLEKHKSNVVKVKWARQNYHHDTASPYSLRLASADTSGTIMLWDVVTGEVKSEFSDGNKVIQDMEWLPSQDTNHSYLVALHPPYSLVLWNAETGSKIWRKSYTESLVSFVFDPFESRNIAFLGQDCIIFVDDFSVTKLPSSNGKKFYISSPSAQGSNRSSNSDTLEKKSSRNLAKRVSRVLVGESKLKSNSNDEESFTLSECLQLAYHNCCRHHLILVYPREVLILDLKINQTVGIIPMERTGSPFMQVLSCRQRDVLMCLHENGSITVRVRRKTNVISTPASEGTGAFDDGLLHPALDISYDLRCQSDPLRITRHSKVFGVSLCSVSERLLALVMSDSRVLFIELKATEYKVGYNYPIQLTSPLYTPGYSLDPLVSFTNTVYCDGSSQFPVTSDIPYPRNSLYDLIGQPQLTAGGGMYETSSPYRVSNHGVALKFMLTGLLSGVASPVSVIRMSPPLTQKNASMYKPLLAVGNHSGSVQIFNLCSGQLDKEFCVHSTVVRGIEWAGLHSFMSFAYADPNASGQVKNEILQVDIISGKETAIRIQRDEESPIHALRVSPMRQYFVITFKDKPFELWDLKNLSLLRDVRKSSARMTAVEWFPASNIRTLKRKLNTENKDSDNSGTINTDSLSSSLSNLDNTTNENKSSGKVTGKEHLVFTDQESTLYHFVIEGSSITDVSKLPVESGLSIITSLAWKNDHLAFGDVDGVISVWDLKGRISRTISTHRSAIKKIRFGPGKANLKFFLKYNDGLDIYEIKSQKEELIVSYKCSKDVPKIIDAEWGQSDKPVVLMSDGCIRVFDLTMKKASSHIMDWDLEEKIFCPSFLPSPGSLLLRTFLQHQPWNDKYTFQLCGMRDEEQEIQTAVNKQLKLINSDLMTYLPSSKFGIAQRCLLVAKLFGDEAELHFWTVALHYIRSEKVAPMSKNVSRSPSEGVIGDLFVPLGPSNKEVHDLVVFDNPTQNNNNSSSNSLLYQQFRDEPLEKCYDVLQDSATFQKYQLDRIALHDSKRATYENTKKCAENYMLLGQTDRAVQLLLETEADNDNYYVDSLRACLVASIRSSGASQSTIKLVATNLIANGKLSEGIQLLCLIDKGLDACRYLQTYGHWEEAVWLAKATLNYSEYSEVVKRWADHLSQHGHKSKAILVMLSLGQFLRVAEMLYGMRYFDRAARFIEACMEFGVIDKSEGNAPLIEAIFLEYSRHLINIGLKQAALHYGKMAGEKGEHLLKEVNILFS
ncbi:WD repeat-containing protein 11-like isoform X2 [Argonauta hians]